MQITYLGPVAPLRGGVAQHGGHVIAALRAAGHRVQVLSWAQQYPALLYQHPQVDPDLSPMEGAEFSLRWWNPWTWWRAGRRARGSDLVVLPWVTPFHALPYAGVLRAAAGAKAVFVVHNALPHEPLPAARWLTRWVLRRADGVVAHARSVERDLRGLGVPAPVYVLPHPPNFPLEPSPLPGGPGLRLLFLGFVRPYKGLDLAIDAVQRLVQRGIDVRLTVAGEFWQPREEVEQQIDRLGLQARVELRPHYHPDAALRELLVQHHLLVAPYRSATQSGVVPLAFAAGRAVVATQVGGLAEVIEDGVNGTLAEAVEADAFARAIERAHAQLDALTLGAARSRTSWDAVAAAVVAVASASEPELLPVRM